MEHRFSILAALVGICIAIALPSVSSAQPIEWQWEWPNTDFTESSIDFSEILEGGPAKDGIPALNDPRFRAVALVTDLGANEPVISLVIGGQANAYPLRIMMWHEIANDVVGGVPVVVTYCPLCNAAMVFDRRVDGQTLTFGVTGKLRHSDMIMYDRQTESWWQQFLGHGIVGEMNGVTLKRLTSRVMPFSEFEKLHPNGFVLTPQEGSSRRYGVNPYRHYDSSAWPFLFQANYDGPVPPLAYVVAVGQDAWPLQALRKMGELKHEDIVISWQRGMNSALDSSRIDRGRDVGFVTVGRLNSDGSIDEISHDMTFAFAFKAFNPEGVIHQAEAIIAGQNSR